MRRGLRTHACGRAPVPCVQQHLTLTTNKESEFDCVGLPTTMVCDPIGYVCATTAQRRSRQEMGVYKGRQKGIHRLRLRDRSKGKGREERVQVPTTPAGIFQIRSKASWEAVVATCHVPTRSLSLSRPLTPTHHMAPRPTTTLIQRSQPTTLSVAIQSPVARSCTFSALCGGVIDGNLAAEDLATFFFFSKLADQSPRSFRVPADR